MGRTPRFLLLIALTGIAVLAAGYALTGTVVTLSVDGIETAVTTHRATVGQVLADAGITPAAQDLVSPPLSSHVESAQTIRVARMRLVTVRVDGMQVDVPTNATTVADALHEGGIMVGSRDVVIAGDHPLALSALLAVQTLPQATGASLASFVASPSSAAVPLSPARMRAIFSQRPAAVSLSVRRAVPIKVTDDGVEHTVVTAARTVGEALFGEGIYIYAADVTSPPLDAPVTTAMLVTIRRATLLTVVADGRTFSTRTQAATVRAMLSDEGAPARGKDFSQPALDAPISPGMVVHVTRVREETLTEEEAIPFTTVDQLDGNLELDKSAVMTAGKPGLLKRTVSIVYENNVEVRRVVAREWVDQEPTNQIIAHGTHIVLRSAETVHGPIEYWRQLRVWTSYYTPSTSGTPLDSPYFGITRTGLRATKGIIAVDPIAIPLHTRMYVPGYGFGAAEDTGNLVVGRTIDLAYDDGDASAFQFGWTTIYLLTPVPDHIPYILPDFPSENR